MSANEALRIKFEQIRLVESRIRKNPLSECAKDANEILADIKREVRRAIRKKLESKEGVKIFGCKSGSGEYYYDSWYEMYSVEFDGTKDELLDYLDSEQERSIIDVRAYGYDCTGLSFIANYKAAHVSGNVFKVLLRMQMDV